MPSAVVAAVFEAPFWVKVYFGGVQAGGGILGVIGFFKPALVPSPPVLDGYWKYLGETADGKDVKDKPDKIVLCPNVPGWGLRDAIPKLLVNAMAIYFGTKEAYLIMVACAIWREGFDMLEAFMEYSKGDKGALDKVFKGAPIAKGKFGNPFPPMYSFPPYLGLMIGNLAALYSVLKA